MSSDAAVYRISDLEIRVLSDGRFWQDAGILFGVVPKVMWEGLTPELNERNQIPLALNCLLIRGRGRTVLVETGMGNKLDERRRNTIFPGDYGYLLEDLASAGVQPGDVDAVINTHLHLDHCGWNTVNLHGRVLPTFPNARYYVQRGEFDVAMRPNERTRATYLSENFAPLLESGQLELVDGEFQVTPEVRFLQAPGHTQDHACVAVTAGGENALYTGDLVHNSIGLERLAWIPALDVLPLVSLETKRRLTDQMVRERALVLIAHAPYPGAGRLSEADGRRQWEPV
ncbi:MAG TPA: MBL fold metallo-hydrolase [Dehalococcoidia bacterium]|nr:MBL fold metallo-hydrolase [Dehalococcoidia bacterium]